jgi:hypothetical protein
MKCCNTSYTIGKLGQFFEERSRFLEEGVHFAFPPAPSFSPTSGEEKALEYYRKA